MMDRLGKLKIVKKVVVEALGMSALILYKLKN